MWFGYSTISGWTGWKKHKQLRRIRSIFGLYEMGRGQGPEKRLIPALEAVDARIFGADHSVLGILSMSMTYLYPAVLCLL